jgi:hypothetical protein
MYLVLPAIASAIKVARNIKETESTNDFSIPNAIQHHFLSILLRFVSEKPDWINVSKSRIYEVLFSKDLHYLKIVSISVILMLSKVIMKIFTHF